MIYIGIFLLTFLTTYFLVPLNRRFSEKMGIIDHPRERRVHQISTPKSGGISIFLGLIITQALLILFGKQEFNNYFIGLICGSFFIFILGLMDDIHNLNAWKKIIVELIIISFMITLGFRITLITNPFGPSINAGIFSIPFTILWFLLIINSINLIDGLDGLATGISAIVTLILGLASIVCGNIFIAYFAFSICGCCVAFLRYNFHPAKIFLGDAGSLLLGFNIAAISVAGNIQFKGTTAMTMLIPIIVLFIPLFDTLLTIIRRWRSSKALFQGDNNHLHHKMLDIGLPYKTVVLIGYFLTFLFGIISLGFLLIDKKILLSLLVILGVLVFIIFHIIKKDLFKSEKNKK
ncbi:MAG: undecaprenyl/decaprenyl-phosphate alpha-N-acetylglucosaminyl 1-phosphate transferase [Candidatus Cloacimonetes bacterium]|nr:undecaprenyl/decaprenyl-phosphate alpha-N-acetylglucosaminyl 1-phosphate transferase [Candidatus Cloacimonadota bacterium]